MFQTGDLALYIGFASEARVLAATNPNLNFKVAPLPQPGTATLKSTYGLLYSFMTARGSKNPSGAYKAMARLTKTSEQAIAAQATGLAPVSRAALTNPPADPVATVAYSSALYARGWLSPTPVLTDPVFSSMIGNVVTGRLHPDAALSRAASAISSLLRQ
jgi:ABC-type glycerol-3-phosphate transport system substrate-binding protein